MKLDSELLRGSAPLAVLKLLERSEMYGYQLVEALSRRTDGVLALGQSTLYPLLYNLEAKSLIEGVWRDAPAADGGRARKYYRLTGKGRKRLAADTRQWQLLASAMASLGLAPGLQP